MVGAVCTYEDSEEVEAELEKQEEGVFRSRDKESRWD
jgi:hypothetical protein